MITNRHRRDGLPIRLSKMNVVHFCGILTAAIFLASCNVSRTVTTQSQYIQKGDTSVVIQTRTVESYDATKKL